MRNIIENQVSSLQIQLLPKPDRIRQVLDSPQQAIRELCNREFYFFLEHFWPTICHDPFQSNWHIKYLCDELQVMAERVALRQPNEYDLIINVPPGTSKTTICSVMFPVWCWTKWYWMRFLTFSYSAPISNKPADASRKILQSAMFRNVYPDIMMRKGKEGVTDYEIIAFVDGYWQSGGGRFSSSVGGTGTGLHGDFIIVDDPLNPQQAASDVELEGVIQWFDQTLPTRKTNKRVTPTILIMQRLHQGDPSGHLLAKKKLKVRHICLPGEINTGEYVEQVKPKELVHRYVDGLLDPMRLSRQVLLDLEEHLGQFGYASQVGQNPVPPTGGMFQVDKFIILEAMPTMTNVVKIVRYWDKAGTEEAVKSRAKGSAWTVGVKMAVFTNGKFIILDVKRGRWGAEVREEIIRATAEADGPQVEIGHEQEPGSGGKESAEATTRNLAGFVSYADRPVGNKIARADPWSVQVNRSNVMLVRGDWTRDYIEEHRYFPFGNFKDQVDASSGGFSKLARRKEAGLLFGRKK